MRVVLVPWLREGGGEPDCVIWLVLGPCPGWRQQIAGTLHGFSGCQLQGPSLLQARWSSGCSGRLSAGPGLGLLDQEFHPFPGFSILLFPIGLSCFFWQLWVGIWVESSKDFTYCKILSFFWAPSKRVIRKGMLAKVATPRDQIKY